MIKDASLLTLESSQCRDIAFVCHDHDHDHEHKLSRNYMP